MNSTRLQIMGWALLVVGGSVGVAAANAPAAPPGPAPPLATPQVTVNGYRFVVDRLIQQQNLALVFTDETGQPECRQSVQLTLAVFPPDPKQLLNIHGLRQPPVGQSGEREIPFSSYYSSDMHANGDGSWRMAFGVQNLDASVSRIENFRGVLEVYPRAPLVTLDFPWPLKEGQSLEQEGYRATIRAVRPRTGGWTIEVETQYPTAQSVLQATADNPTPVALITAQGRALSPMGHNASTNVRNDRVVRSFGLYFAELNEPPAKLRVQSVVRSGTPTRVAFSFPEIVLPDTRFQPATAPETAAVTEVPLDSPLYDESGGMLTLPLRYPTEGMRRGRLLIGLARMEPAGPGPWRWLEARVTGSDSLQVTRLQPGRYRVGYAWMAGQETGSSEPKDLPRNAVRLPGQADVIVPAGKSVMAPPVELGASE